MLDLTYGSARVIGNGPRLRDVAARLVDALAHGEGMTVSPRTGDLVRPVGYMVGKACGIPGHIFGDSDVSRGDRNRIVDLMARHLEDFPMWAMRETYVYVGVWIDEDTGKAWLDLSELHKDREEAMRLGRERGELAIWCLHDEEEIRL